MLRTVVVLAFSLLLTAPATATEEEGLDAPVLTGYTAQAVYLEWSPVGGATGYEVHRDGILIASTGEQELSYVDPDPTAPDAAEYMVRATAGDQVGPFSSIFPRDQEPCLYIYKPPTISVGITPRNCIALARAILDNVTIQQG